jgi:hypothetical protein
MRTRATSGPAAHRASSANGRRPAHQAIANGGREAKSPRPCRARIDQPTGARMRGKGVRGHREGDHKQLEQSGAPSSRGACNRTVRKGKLLLGHRSLPNLDPAPDFRAPRLLSRVEPTAAPSLPALTIFMPLPGMELDHPGIEADPPSSRVGAASGLLRCIRFKSKAAAAGTELGTHHLGGSGWAGQAMAKLGLGWARTGAVPQIVWRGSLQKRKRHQTAGAEDADNCPNHVGPRGVVAVLRSRFVSDRHFLAPACYPRSIGRAPLWVYAALS